MAIALGDGMTITTACTVPTVTRTDALETADWVDAHGDYLFHFAVGQVRDAGVAEDLVQDTFLAALKARHRFAGQSSDRTWLTSILRHKICDHLRRTCRERAVRAEGPAGLADDVSWDEAVMWLHDVAAESQLPDRGLEWAEFREQLEHALGKLPPRVAQVFQLYAVEECPNAVVCERLNISESNLWVMLHRARKQLRRHLSDWWNGQADDRGCRDGANATAVQA
jgi:RNA polymerase sigma-70 factor, ECF subfamily